MIIGAHPDDAEKAGGLAALYIENGHEVQLVSVTNGDKGHQTLGGAALARRRMQEAACSGSVIGAEYIVMNNRDGELVPGVPAMTSNPVVFYLSGGTDPEVVIGIDEVLEKKAGMYHCHESQMYEWLPWVGHYDEQVPEGEEDRKQWLMDRLAPMWANTADRYRDALARNSAPDSKKSGFISTKKFFTPPVPAALKNSSQSTIPCPRGTCVSMSSA